MALIRNRKPASPAALGRRALARVSARALALAVMIAVALTVSFQGPAAAQGMARLSAADRADIQRIEAYLNAISTMESRFLQVASDGDYSEGVLYFSRPGKMRIDYDDPKPIIIVSDGVNLAYYDEELQQVSYFDVQSTQAAILLDETISFFAGDVIVTAFERGPGVLRLTVIKGSDPLEGNLTLIFSDRPLGLKKWTVIDAQGVVTNVSLLGPRFGAPLNPDLFEIEEPVETVQ